MHSILIAEDESRIASFIEKGLKANGFTTTIAPCGEDAIAFVLADDYDLLILDLGLPDIDGLQVVESLRGQGAKLPIVILTARDDINDKVAGLEGGADDYITKPFRFEELIARVRVRLRHRYNIHQSMGETTLQVDELTLDLQTRRANVNGDLVDLPAREFTLAEAFFRHPGQVLSREQLLSRVWGYDYSPGSNIVDVYVGYLEKTRC